MLCTVFFNNKASYRKENVFFQIVTNLQKMFQLKKSMYKWTGVV